MTKVCFIIPPVTSYHGSVDIPTTTFFFSSITKQLGFSTIVVDFDLLSKYSPSIPLTQDFFPSATALIAEYNAEILFFPVLESNLVITLRLAGLVKKKNLFSRIILLGKCSNSGHLLSVYPFVEKIIHDDNLQPFLDIFQTITGKQGASSALLIQQQKILNRGPLHPIYLDASLLELDLYKKLNPEMSLPILSTIAGMNNQYLEVLGEYRLSDILTQLQLVTEINRFSLRAPPSVSNITWLKLLCSEIESFPAKIEWESELTDIIESDQLLHRIAECGCKSVTIVTRTAHIDDTMSNILHFLNQCKQLGIEVLFSHRLTHSQDDEDHLSRLIQFVTLLSFYRLGVKHRYKYVFLKESTELSRHHTVGLKLNSSKVNSELPFITEALLEEIKKETDLYHYFYRYPSNNFSSQEIEKILRVVVLIEYIHPLLSYLLTKQQEEVIPELKKVYTLVEKFILIDAQGNAKYMIESLLATVFQYLQDIGHIHEDEDKNRFRVTLMKLKTLNHIVM